MTTCADWKAALARTPRDPSLWEVLGDWLEDGNEWDSGSPILTAHLARLVAWRLRMGDERWHGVVELEHLACDVCGNWPDETGELRHGKGCYTQSEDGGGESYEEVFTFALLFDRPGVVADWDKQQGDWVAAPGQIIPGHLSELITWLRASGDTWKADEIARLKVSLVNGDWWVFEQERNADRLSVFATYPDACRELVARVGEVLCEECVCRSTRPGHCVKCHGLGFVGRATK